MVGPNGAAPARDDVDELLMSGGGGRSFFTKDSPVGAQVTGRIVAKQKRQATDPKNKMPQWWHNGAKVTIDQGPENVVWDVVITIQTALRDDPDDDGLRSLWIKGYGRQRRDLADAVVKAGASGLEIGGTITQTFVGHEPSTYGDPAKVYTFTYVKAPDAVDTLLTTPQPAAQQAPVAPAQAAPAPQYQAPPAAPVAPAPVAPAPAPTPAAPPAGADGGPKGRYQAMLSLGLPAEQALQLLAQQTGIPADQLAPLIA